MRRLVASLGALLVIPLTVSSVGKAAESIMSAQRTSSATSAGVSSPNCARPMSAMSFVHEPYLPS